MSNWLASPQHLNPASVTDKTIVVLPLGATEQHGPHLPPQTDTLIAQGVCEHLAAILPKTIDARLLPAEPVGYSLEHMDHPGSRTLAFDEAVNRWLNIGKTLSNKGVRRFIMLNAHGGNSPLMTVVAQELRVRHSMLAVATSWTRFVKQSGIVSAEEESFGVHGGDIETSVMLALHPDKVDMAKAENFPNLQQSLAIDYSHLRAYGPHAFGWKAADLNPQGVTGNARVATAKKGRQLLDRAATGLVELLQDIAGFDLALLKDA